MHTIQNGSHKERAEDYKAEDAITCFRYTRENSELSIDLVTYIGDQICGH